ncbi:MAG: 1-deoxy-D-xylulose-5-phosphate synthase [Nitrospiraceae bacterium]|nr:1-deoxy-D-xylulose-5-phosphate synthase [Nitrospiraceae bacterium]
MPDAVRGGECPLLARVNNAADLAAFSMEELEALVPELRRTIIETVSTNGGHLASPLGVVELSVALCRVHDFEKDAVVWDVGHQCYAYKLLTGRRDRFSTLRIKGGISGYPRRSESPCDSFGTGHSSTSISAALGMAIARDRQGQDHRVIAVIGDGAMTGGMAMEALSHAGHVGTDLLVILNDNEMSIARNVGALSAYFSRLITARGYKRAKEDVASFVRRILGPRLTETAQRMERSVKGFITPGGLFQELGFNYVGPIDGHDLPALVEILSRLKEMHGPILLHCATQKGRGYSEAERDPSKYHGVSPLQITTTENEGEARPPAKLSSAPSAKTFTDVFADALIDAAEQDPNIVGITAAMPTGTGLGKFQERFPERFHDVGICEQHAVTFAAGLAAKGSRPVIALYSTFLQRGYDQIIHDVCLQNLPVLFAIDRAGLVGQDCPTHIGTFDLSFLRSIPNLTLLAPRDDLDLTAMVHWALKHPGPVAIRYPREKAPTIGPVDSRDVTRGSILRNGADVMLAGLGPCVGACIEAAELLEQDGLAVGVADARVVKPLDGDLFAQIADLPLITVEENVLAGGFGAAVMEYYEMTGRLSGVRLRRVGLPDRFIDHAKREEQLAELGLDAAGIRSAALAFLTRHAVPTAK